ncbi:DUF397 domain-containing protein [Actinomadura sp. WMMB 499]|uniref:DUF397 domain-containing protein n=1 Tax=Actinomadura sp. WMMB 499 TaxID=1219491 RepID=UPI001243D964|nr:DUF397 domain-containing protein [Actinomadura sp. WMMB 499]QFG22490.1 DUF397 domain-containing protein [Actinomadura sp. WMMB 499]
MTTHWRKSSYSGAINDEACVEVADLSIGIGIRDSKDSNGDCLAVSRGAFAGLLREARLGDLDVPQ